MKGANFCPVCGKQEGRFIKGFCEECFLKSHALLDVPETIEFEQCKECEKARLFGKFVPLEKEKLASLVEKKVKVHGLETASTAVSVEEGEEGFTAHVQVKGIIDSVPLSFEREAGLVPVPVQCDSCMKLSSQYHEALIQLRGRDKKRLEQVLQALIKVIESKRSKDSLAVVTDVAKSRQGFDLKVGSRKAARNAMQFAQRKFNAETNTSKKSLKRNRLRFTFLVRV